MVLVLLEVDEEGILEASLQALTLGRDIAEANGATVDGVVVGADTDGIAETAGDHGVDTVFAVDHPDLEAFAPRAWSTALIELAEETAAEAVVAAGTDRGNEVMAHFGAQTGTPIAANCLSVSVDDAYTVTRQRWGGSLIEHATLGGDRKLLTTAPHELQEEIVGGDPATIESHEPSLSEADLRVQIDRFEAAEVEGISIDDADVVIGGGRGVGSADGFDKLEELASRIDAAVGSSRAAVNEGWRPHDDQIGLTGHKIAPELYIPAGISGAVQHIVGCKGSKHILAINTDPEAGIIQKANWAVLGDLHEVIPAITEEIDRRRSE